MRGIDLSSYQIGQREIDSLSACDVQIRFEYFIKRVADWGEIWTLKDEDGYVLFGDADRQELVPVWPFREFAVQCCDGIWKNASAVSISTVEFMTKWIPGTTVDSRKVAVFPTRGGNAATVTAQVLNDALRAALDEIE